MDGLLLTASQEQMGSLACQELQRLSRLVMDLRMEINHKNQKLREMEEMNDKTCADLGKKIANLATEVYFILLEMKRKCSEAAATVKELLVEKDKLRLEYIKGRGEMQNLKEENKKLRHELKLRSIREENAKMKSELQFRCITAENERLNYELQSNKKEFVRRANMQENFFMAEMKRLKCKVESETLQFELRLKELEELEVISKKEEGWENELHMLKRKNAETMLLKEQLNEHRNIVEKKLMCLTSQELPYVITNILVKQLERLENMEGRANKAEKESMYLKAQLEELRMRRHEYLGQKNDLNGISSSSGTEQLTLVKQLQEQHCDHLHDSRKSESSHENIELLEEKLSKENDHRERVEPVLGLSESELLAKKLDEELSSTKMVTEDIIPGVSYSDDKPIKFAALQKEVPESMVKADLKQISMQLGDSSEALRTMVDGDRGRWKQKYSRKRLRKSVPVPN